MTWSFPFGRSVPAARLRPQGVLPCERAIGPPMQTLPRGALFRAEIAILLTR